MSEPIILTLPPPPTLNNLFVNAGSQGAREVCAVQVVGGHGWLGPEAPAAWSYRRAMGK